MQRSDPRPSTEYHGIDHRARRQQEQQAWTATTTRVPPRRLLPLTVLQVGVVAAEVLLSLAARPPEARCRLAPPARTAGVERARYLSGGRGRANDGAAARRIAAPAAPTPATPTGPARLSCRQQPERLVAQNNLRRCRRLRVVPPLLLQPPRRSPAQQASLGPEDQAEVRATTAPGISRGEGPDRAPQKRPGRGPGRGQLRPWTSTGSGV